MIRAKWTMRLGILGAVVSVAVLAISAATTSVAASGAAQTVTGVHANEEFCKIIVRQVEQFGLFAKVDLFDMTKRAKYWSDQKELNATLVKTAPASLASDVALQTKNSNAMMDAQAARNATNIKASAAALRSPEHLAAARRMNDYCGVKLPASK